MSEDGVTEYGKRAVIKGDDCPNPISEGLFETPTKESTEANTFSFGGWSLTAGGSVESSPFSDVEENKTLYAVFESAVRYYTVNFYDGSTLLKSEQVAYGGSSSYVYNKTDYLFTGWTPEPTNITGDMDCVGTWIIDDGYIHDDWDVISQSVTDGTYKTKYALGDLKQVSVVDYDGTTRVLDMEIVAFDHDNLADGSGKAGITFLSTELLKMNGFTASSSGTSGYWWGEPEWLTASVRSARSYLNGTSYVYKGFPDTLKNNIKTVKKYSQKYDLTLGETDDKVWIPSMTEVGLTSSNSDIIVDGQGDCYSYKFTDDVSRKRNQPEQTFAMSWATRSRMNQVGKHLGVNMYGKFDSVSVAYNKSIYSLIGFCI